MGVGRNGFWLFFFILEGPLLVIGAICNIQIGTIIDGMQGTVIALITILSLPPRSGGCVYLLYIKPVL